MKNRMNLLVHFVIYGDANFENFQNITCAHKSRNALAFIRFPILIISNSFLVLLMAAKKI